ncbi:MAG: hypothetical protein IPH48_01280 [bacterium]|nr:hypothetical protein [bacterium]
MGPANTGAKCAASCRRRRGLSAGPAPPVASGGSTARPSLTLHDTDPLSAAFAHDLNYYLPADLLKKVDMASMLTRLECRAPFLDHRLVEFCFRPSPGPQDRRRISQRPAEGALADRLPRDVLERPKQGFGAPVTDWVQGPLRDLARDLLRPGCRCEAWV